MKLRAAFMGSPPFAVPSLEAVAEACDLRVVVCQPDKPAGRGRKLTPPAVKAAAHALGVPVLQPTKMKDGSLAAALEPHDLDVAIVVAFGRILPPRLLELPRHGCINVHASILPRWRGAAPMQRAVLAGDPQTGVSLMRMDEGLDTGPVYRIVTTPIDAQETSGDLSLRLAEIGARALRELLDVFPDVPPPQPQPTAGVTHAAMLAKDEGITDFSRAVKEVVDHVRGMDPWPVAVTTHDGEPLRLFGATRASEGVASVTAGTIVAVDVAHGIDIACADGLVRISEVQPAGKRRMPAGAWAVGRRIIAGARLGD
jgi:methionyl-tRNA formyltransferase